MRLFRIASLFLVFFCAKITVSQYTIPVVFHVIHQNGPENISDEQIVDQIAILNRDFDNPDTSVIIDTFKPLIADCDIQFKLAQLDPQGNCTNGITRHFSTLTTTGDHQVKSIVHWPPDEYLNFYVVVNAAGLAGHALMPSQADSFPQWDGIVIGHNYTGSIGTSSVATSVVATHEVGHYLGLQHVWGGNNVPNFFYLPVSQASNCGTDDGIGDTPNTIGNQSCNHSQMNCGTLDNVQNFMDYSYCGAMFTLGQKTRMHLMLDSSMADRNNLWSQANLIKTGVDTIPTWLCGADIEVNKRVVCVGDTVEFSDVSKHQIQTRNWNFYGGSSVSTTDSLIKVVYNTVGNYDVKLVVGTSLETDSVLLQNFISVVSNPGTYTGIIEDMEYLQPFPSDKWMIFSDNDTAYFEETTLAAYSGTKSLYFNNFLNSGVVELVSTSMDLTAPGSKELIFRHAYAEKEVNPYNKFEVFFSNNCGETWALNKTLVASLLKTKSTPDTNSFVPNGQGEWKTTSVNIPASYFTPNFRVKFRFTGSPQGNNFYLDDINVIPTGTIGINESWMSNIKVFPNPADSEIMINDLPVKGQLMILNAEGKILISKKIKKSNQNIDVSRFKSGNYIVKVVYQDKEFTGNFIKL